MTDKKDRERVIAEITLSHLMRLGNEQGCPVSREQALAFLNQEGRAFRNVEAHDAGGRELHRMQFVPTFLQLPRTQRIRVWASTGAISGQCSTVAWFRVHSTHVAGARIWSPVCITSRLLRRYQHSSSVHALVREEPYAAIECRHR
jgi:hypothetical protein